MVNVKVACIMSVNHAGSCQMWNIVCEVSLCEVLPYCESSLLTKRDRARRLARNHASR